MDQALPAALSDVASSDFEVESCRAACGQSTKFQLLGTDVALSAADVAEYLASIRLPPSPRSILRLTKRIYLT